MRTKSTKRDTPWRKIRVVTLLTLVVNNVTLVDGGELVKEKSDRTVA